MTDQPEQLSPLQLQRLMGHRLGPYCSFNPVSRTQIWQWCSAMGDRNPLYLDDNYREKNEFNKVVAPPAMMQMWTMRDVNDNFAPGSTDAPPYKVFDDMKALGYPANVAVSYEINFHRYLQEGERPKHFTTIVKISDCKTTALGKGYFVTEKVEYLTEENNDPFAEALISYFQYQPHTQPSAGEPTDQAKPQVSSKENDKLWQTAFINLTSNDITVGEKLPELAIPITHRQIVTGAMATQDFIPVHHNVEAAKAAAMPNIFMNILTTSGLSARYLSDWAGPDSRLKHLNFRLLAPNLPGDTMIMQGKVKALTEQDNKPAVDIEFSGKNNLGLHVSGSATLALSR